MVVVDPGDLCPVVGILLLLSTAVPFLEKKVDPRLSRGALVAVSRSSKSPKKVLHMKSCWHGQDPGNCDLNYGLGRMMEKAH